MEAYASGCPLFVCWLAAYDDPPVCWLAGVRSGLPVALLLAVGGTPVLGYRRLLSCSAHSLAGLWLSFGLPPLDRGFAVSRSIQAAPHIFTGRPSPCGSPPDLR